MEHRAPGNSSASLASSQQSKPRGSRAMWVLIAYAFSGMGLLAAFWEKPDGARRSQWTGHVAGVAHAAF